MGAHQDFERAYLNPSNELHADAAAALCCLVDARKDLVGAAIAASWILAMHLQALVLAVGTLRQGGVQREDAVGRRAADAAPRDQLVALPAGASAAAFRLCSPLESFAPSLLCWL